MTREISRAVMETVGFRLHTEGGLPPSLADEARVLLDALRKR